MGVSKNRGGPRKWMVYNGKPENPVKMVHKVHKVHDLPYHKEKPMVEFFIHSTRSHGSNPGNMQRMEGGWATTFCSSKNVIPQQKGPKTPVISVALRILGMSWGVKTTCFEAPRVSLGGSGVSIGRFRILREG